MSYLRNTWYVAAWDNEIETGTVLARKLLDVPVVLFRNEDGVVHALLDRCPHRFVPLSKGRLCGSSIQCAYHGLEFDGTGNCTKNPHGDGLIPKAAKVKSFQVMEQHSLIWIWMGEPEKADTSMIPDFSKSLDPEKRYVGKDYLLAKANYQLEIDNILDLSHVEFLHGTTLGSDAVKHAETCVVQEGNTVYSNRLMRNEIVTHSLASTYGIPAGVPVDRWMDVRWEAPAQMELWSGWAPAGADNPREVGKKIPFVHIFTPETEATTHYWFGTSYPMKMGEEGKRRAERDVAYLRVPFENEDLPMLEVQQEAMRNSSFWSLKPVLLPSDGPAVRARRVLDAMIKAEQSHSNQPPVPTEQGDQA